jgi:hypothetical protein
VDVIPLFKSLFFSESSKDNSTDDQHVIRKGKRKSDQKPAKELTEAKIRKAQKGRYMSNTNDT